MSELQKIRVVKTEFGPSNRLGVYSKKTTYYTVKSTGKKAISVVENHCWFTPIFACYVCGKIGAPKKVRPRSGSRYWAVGRNWIERTKEIYGKYIEGEDVLCTSCFIKKRTFVEKMYEADEIKRLINQLKKEISHERKHQNDRSNA